MRLNPAPKVFGHGVHRVIAPEQTFQRIQPIARRAGVTRLSDITGLDRVGIPTYSAVVPKSRDVLSIYNGKGVSRIDAACGALMEAIERQTALEWKGRFVRASYDEISRCAAALHPGSLVQKLHPGYTDRLPLHWVEGYDLVSGSAVLVPAAVAAFRIGKDCGPPCLELESSNGLASGNVLEEAICHALCELVERDTWTMAELLAHWLPRWKHERSKGASPGEECRDDIERFPDVDLSGANGGISWMLRRFARCGVQPKVKDITGDLGVPTMLATAVEESGAGLPMAHSGWGAHPDARVAVIRALTELAQTRAVDIQGVREDIAQPTDDVPVYMTHAKRPRTVDHRSWYYASSSRRRPLNRIPSAVNADILDDIGFMIARLRAQGLKQVIAVDLTDPDLAVPVVRVIVPGLESWAVDHGCIGARATRLWSANE